MSCLINAIAKNGNDSILFKELRSRFNRQLCIEIYERVTSDKFMELTRNIATLDENGEPTIDFILNNFDVKSLSDFSSIKNDILKKVNPTNKTFNTPQEREDAIRKAISFNRNDDINSQAIVLPIVTGVNNGQNTVELNVVSSDIKSRQDAKNLEDGVLINNFLRNKLSEWGLSIGSLTNEESMLGVNGVTDFRNPIRNAEGFIELIRLAKGINGENALPEEFSHLLVNLLQDNTIVKRMINFLLQNENAVKEILGNSYKSYSEAYNNIDDFNLQMAKEALGHVIHQEMFKNVDLLNKPKSENSGFFSRLKNLLNRFVNWIKNIFNKFDEHEIAEGVYNVSKDASLLVNELFSDNIQVDLSNLKSDEVFYQINENIANSEQLLAMSKRIANRLNYSMDKLNAMNNIRGTIAVEDKNRFDLENVSFNISESLENHAEILVKNINLFARKFKLMQSNLKKDLKLEDLAKMAKISRDWNDFYNCYKCEFASDDGTPTSLMSMMLEYANVFSKSTEITPENIDKLLKSNDVEINSLNIFLKDTGITIDKIAYPFVERISEMLNDLYNHKLDIKKPNENGEIDQNEEILSNIAKSLYQIIQRKNKLYGSLMSSNATLDTINGYLYQECSSELVFKMFEPYIREEVGEMQKEYANQFRMLDSVFKKENEWYKMLEVPSNFNEMTPEAQKEFLRNRLFDRKNISMYNYLISSASECDSLIVRILDHIIKQVVDKAKNENLKMEEDLIYWAEKWKRQGISDYSFLYEKDSNNKKTGFYIDIYDTDRISKEYNELKNKWKKIEEENDGLTKEQKSKKNKEYKEFWKSIDEKYYSNDFKKLNKQQKEFALSFFERFDKAKNNFGYKTSDDIKKMRKRSIIAIEKGFFENIKSDSRGFYHALKNKWNLRSREYEYGSKEKFTDFSGRQMNLLPRFFESKNENEDWNNMSEDAISTLLAYSAKSTQYDKFSKIADAMEVILTNVRHNHSVSTDAWTGQIKVNDDGTVTDENAKSRILATFGNDNVYNRLEKLIEMQFYGKLKSNEGVLEFVAPKIKNKNNSEEEGDEKKIAISGNKIADQLSSMTSLSTIAWNTLTDINNVLTGVHQMNLETIHGTHFGPSDLFKADCYWAKNVPKFGWEMARNVKTNPLALIQKIFDVGLEYNKSLNKIKFNDTLGKILNSDLAFCGMNIGEFFMSMRTMLALLSSYKLHNKNNPKQIISLLDALEVVPVDGKDISLGATLKIRKGFVKENGEEFDLFGEDKNKLSRKCSHINHEMHGIYDNENISVAQQKAIGRLIFTFRKWIPPSLERRYKHTIYNYDTGKYEQGFYRTLFGFVKSRIFVTQASTLHWNELAPEVKHNIIKGLWELSAKLILMVLSQYIKSIPDDDDEILEDDRNIAANGEMTLLDSLFNDFNFNKWWCDTVKYCTVKQNSELGMLTPTFAILFEGKRFLESPTATLNTVTKLLNLLQSICWPMDYVDTIRSGKLKGMTRLEANFYRSPLSAWINQFYKTLHPKESMQFYF